MGQLSGVPFLCSVVPIHYIFTNLATVFHQINMPFDKTLPAEVLTRVFGTLVKDWLSGTTDNDALRDSEELFTIGSAMIASKDT